MKRKELTKTFIIISNWKYPLVSMFYTKVGLFQRFKEYIKNLHHVQLNFLKKGGQDTIIDHAEFYLNYQINSDMKKHVLHGVWLKVIKPKVTPIGAWADLRQRLSERWSGRCLGEWPRTSVKESNLVSIYLARNDRQLKCGVHFIKFI